MATDTQQPKAAVVPLVIWRFDDSVVRSHVIAETQEQATEIFDRVMGREYREGMDDVSVRVYEIPGATVLPIDIDGSGEFVRKTGDEWIAHHRVPRFL